MNFSHASVLSIALFASAAQADYSLTILHTNDFHSRFEPISKYDSGCSAQDNIDAKCFGGSARLSTAIRAARAKHPNNILVDGGDQFQGTLFYTYYKGKLAAEMMNRLGYDGMTVGNHEFDDGPEVLRAFVETVKFPVLMSNADISQEPLLVDKIKKSVIIEKNGEKIGLIGLTPVNTDELASPGPNIRFSDPSKAVQSEVDRLSAEGINKIVVLSHSGYQVDQAVAANTQGVDVIVGGHSNTLLSNTSDRALGPYPTMVGETAIVQAYAYGKLLGELNLVFDDNGVIKSAEGEPYVMDGSVEEDSEVVERIAQMAKPLESIRKQKVGEAAAAIDGSREQCRVAECPMGNLVADAMLARVADQGVRVALTNGGGLRASIDAGEVTMGEVLGVLPFLNTLSTFNLNGAQLVTALENGVSQVEEGAGRFPQVAGLKFSWDPSIAAGQSRVTSVMVKNKDGSFSPVDPTASYGVVSNNYLRSGGDGYKVLKEAENAYDYGPSLDAVVADYLEVNSPYRPYLDGRISH